MLAAAFFVVTMVVFMMRAENEGEGGILALTALAQRCYRKGTRARWIVTVLGILGAALFYGDGVITPAVSVLSAVEGLSIYTPAFEQYIIPIAVGILIALFAIQKHGTGAIGRFFGPTMVLWFSVLEQALQVLPLFAAAHLVALVVRLASGGAFPGWALLAAPALESLLWPVAAWFLLAPQRRAPDPDENRPL